MSLTYRTVPRNERRITDLKFNNRRLPAAQIDRVNEDEGVRRARAIYFRGCYKRKDDSIEGIQLLAERSVPDPSDPNKSLVAISDFFVSEDGVSPGFPTERYRLRR